MQQVITPALAPAIAAFVVGIVSNLYSRYTLKTAAVPVIAGVLLLVPGGKMLSSYTAACPSEETFRIASCTRLLIRAGSLVLFSCFSCAYPAIAVRGVAALLDNDTLNGIDVGFRMVIAGVSLVLGIFSANFISTLRSPESEDKLL